MSQSNTQNNNSNTVKMASYAQLERLMRLLEDVLVPPQQKAFVRKYLAHRNHTMKGASVVIKKTIASKGERTYRVQLNEEAALKAQVVEQTKQEEREELEAFLREPTQLVLGV